MKALKKQFCSLCLLLAFILLSCGNSFADAGSYWEHLRSFYFSVVSYISTIWERPMKHVKVERISGTELKIKFPDSDSCDRFCKLLDSLSSFFSTHDIPIVKDETKIQNVSEAGTEKDLEYSREYLRLQKAKSLYDHLSEELSKEASSLSAIVLLEKAELPVELDLSKSSVTSDPFGLRLRGSLTKFSEPQNYADVKKVKRAVRDCMSKLRLKEHKGGFFTVEIESSEFEKFAAELWQKVKSGFVNSELSDSEQLERELPENKIMEAIAKANSEGKNGLLLLFSWGSDVIYKAAMAEVLSEGKLYPPKRGYYVQKGGAAEIAPEKIKKCLLSEGFCQNGNFSYQKVVKGKKTELVFQLSNAPNYETAEDYYEAFAEELLKLK